MFSVTLNAFDVSMATTQLTCAACYEVLWPWHTKQEMEGRHLRMNWVVVTDENGKRLRMKWNTSRDD